ncbi:hypothetical protein [Micromonospora fluostatini]|uniref:hypothetical protein n=1 Tax=Micromonospora sp. JCM 30529 TaxID=3421643 RepID=UPI003D18492F
MFDTAGLTAIVVARQEGERISLVGFLLDTYCLGAKNALPAITLAGPDVSPFIDEFFGAYSRPPMPAPISLIEELVHGSVAYARGLGFEPHPDYYSAAAHLGPWQPPGRITFGWEGRPHFVQGPSDNPDRVRRTLDRSVGPGNYGFLMVADI